MTKYLAKIIATDQEGLQMISACSSGAKVKVEDIKYLKSNKVFLLSIQRNKIENNQEDKIKLDYVRFTSDHFTSETKITDQTLKDFFQANKTQFEIPPQIRAKYVKIKSKDYESQIEPRDEDIQDYYQTRIADFQVKKKYTASHILINLKPSEINLSLIHI